MEYCILDLSTIRYRWNADHTAVRMFSPTRELLADLVLPAGTSDREAAFLCCEHALDKSRLRRFAQDGTAVRTRVALYNPLTGEVALGSTPDTIVYGGAVLETPAHGVLGTVSGEELVLEDATRLSRVESTFTSLTRRLATLRDN